MQCGVSFDVAVEDVVIPDTTIDGHVNGPSANRVVGKRVECDIVVALGTKDVQVGDVVGVDRG